METYIIVMSEDGCEWGCTSAENHVRCPQLSRDTEGNPMLLIDVFPASTWEQAKERQEELMREFCEETRGQ